MTENAVRMMLQAAGVFKKPVRLILFVNDVGCETCAEARQTAQFIKKNQPLVALEIYDQVMDRDKTQLYGIRRVPAMVVQDNDGHTAIFYGLVEDVFFLDPYRCPSRCFGRANLVSRGYPFDAPPSDENGQFAGIR